MERTNFHPMGLQGPPESVGSGEGAEVIIDHANPNPSPAFPGQQIGKVTPSFIIPKNVEFHTDQSLRFLHCLEDFLEGGASILQDLNGIPCEKGCLTDFLQEFAEKSLFHAFS